jgi:hypothetical protein
VTGRPADPELDELNPTSAEAEGNCMNEICKVVAGGAGTAALAWRDVPAWLIVLVVLIVVVLDRTVPQDSPDRLAWWQPVLPSRRRTRRSTPHHRRSRRRRRE